MHKYEGETGRNLSGFSAPRPLAIVVAALTLTRVVLGQTPNLDAPHEPDRFMVRFKQGTSEQGRQVAHARTGGVEVKRFRYVDGLTLVSVSAATLADALEGYLNDPDVLYAEPCYLVQAAAIPNDFYFGHLWGLRNTGQLVPGSGYGTPGADIRAVKAWDMWTGGADFKVAVVDTGVDYNHPDLKGPSWEEGNIWTNYEELNGTPDFDDDENGWIDDIHGYNFRYPDDPPLDYRGHGTHVAGTIAAVGNNGIGVVGVNWQAKIVALKFIGSGGVGSVCDAVEAMEYVIDNDIKLSNHSWGPLRLEGGAGAPLPCQSICDIIATAGEEIGHLAIAAAMNGLLYFNATDDVWGQELWVSVGPGAPRLVCPAPPPEGRRGRSSCALGSFRGMLRPGASVLDSSCLLIETLFGGL